MSLCYAFGLIVAPWQPQSSFATQSHLSRYSSSRGHKSTFRNMMDKTDAVGTSKSGVRRPGEDTCDDDLPPSPPARHNFSINTTGEASDGIVASTLTTENQPGHDIRQEQELEDDVERVEVLSTAARTVFKVGMVTEGASRVGAVAVRGIGAEETSSIVSTTNAYQDSFVGDYSHHGEQEEPHDEQVPIEARRVEDDEADIEAQVQTRLKDQAKDIAQMVHKELITNMAVPVDVQPSVGDTALSSVSQDQDSSASVIKKKRIYLILIGVLAIIAAVGIGVGVAVSKRAAADGDDVPPSLGQCSFCFGGFMASNTTSSFVLDNGQTCAEYFGTQTQLESTDPDCTFGQAIAWHTCGCPYLPPPSENPSCSPCETGEVASVEWCKERSAFVAIVGENNATFCTEFMTEFFEVGCTCERAAASEFLSIVKPISGAALNDVDSPQYKALNWLTNFDSASLSAEETPIDIIRDRYVAAVLYYAFGGVTWLEQYNFMTVGDICTWNGNGSDGYQHGIICDGSGNVETLRLSSNNLVGSIPREIGHFFSLETIEMNDNTIEGKLPRTLEKLTVLDHLSFNNNNLTGTLPEFLFLHPMITYVDLDNNTFSGTINAKLGTSPNLQVFWARDSTLTGTIPSSIGQSTVLTSIDLQSNELTGTLPDFASGSQIDQMWLGENRLVGSIPTSIGNLSLLQELSLSDNALSGTLPSELGSLLQLQYLFLSYNSFTGSIPLSLASLPWLSQFTVHGNNLTGGVDNAFCNTTFEKLVVNTCVDPDELECACCTHCCNRDSCTLLNA